MPRAWEARGHAGARSRAERCGRKRVPRDEIRDGVLEYAGRARSAIDDAVEAELQKPAPRDPVASGRRLGV